MTPKSWQKLTLAQQLGNIGSEFSRALKFRAKNDEIQSQKSFVEVLSLLDLTIRNARQSKGLKELTRLREVVGGVMLQLDYDNNETMQILDKYFLSFAIAVRGAR